MENLTYSQPKPSFLDLPLSRHFPVSVEALLVVCLVALSLVSRFYDLGARVMSHDEVNHVVPAFDFSEGRGYRYDPVTHGPLQFHLIAFSYFVFGDDDFTSRIPVAVFSVGTVVFALLAFRRYLGRWGALAAGAMFLISPYMLYYGRYARNEMYIVFWGLATLYALLRYLERGEARTLVFFTLINALHFTDKATSYIFAAEQFLFLGGYLVLRVWRRDWPAPGYRQRFGLSLGAALLVGAGAAGLALVEKPLNPVHIIPVALVAVGAGVFAVVMLVRGLGWQNLRAERAFDLAMLLGTLILPLMAALPVKAAGFNPIDYTTTGILRSAAFIVPLAGVAIALGLWWNARAWPIYAAVFYAPFVLLYSTFFTNSAGLAGGLMGALGYWLEQQAVNRGSQPWFYYALLQIPVYEFLPALGTLLAVFIGLRRRLWQAQPAQPFAPAPLPVAVEETANLAQPVPTLALLIFWSVSSLLAFSVAGEKMPWLTTHIALPLILSAGWAVGYLIETTRWSEARQRRGGVALLLGVVFVPALSGVLTPLSTGFAVASADSLTRLQSGGVFGVSLLAALLSGWGLFRLLTRWEAGQLARAASLAGLVVLAGLTARAAYRAAYINYDYPLEYLVYAHGAPAPKRLLKDIEALSYRTTDSLGLVVAYDNFVRYPYWWYMRHYPNKIDFNEAPTSDVRRAAVILVGDQNQAKLRAIVRKDYLEFSYSRMWWPNQDYWRLKWEDIDAERKTQLPAPTSGTLPPMSLGEYLQRAWGHVQPFFTDARVRSAVYQIWLNRDYTQYAALQNSQASFNLESWSPADRMTVYVRKDLAGQVWNYGASEAPAPTQVTTEEIVPQFNVDLAVGAGGSDPGLFQAPRAIAVAPDGTLYVADSRNHRIQHLSAVGTVLQVWGTQADAGQGQAPGGTFNEPWGVAVGPDGAVYVADTWNHRVQKFSAEGQFIKMWSTWSQDGQTDTFWGPRGIAVDARGRVLVADTGNKRVVVFDAEGNYLSRFGGAGSDPGQLQEPVGVAVDAQNRVYVADTWNQRVQVFAPDAAGTGYTSEVNWPVEAWYGQSLENKPFLAVNSAGQVFITDPEACQVVEYAATGQALAVWMSCSGGPDGFGMPAGVAIEAAGSFWVSDSGNNRLLHFPAP